MKNIRYFILFLFTFNTSLLFGKEFQIRSTIFQGSKMPYVLTSGEGPLDRYFTLNLPLEPVAELFKELLIFERRPMASRGEAHITLITPMEFWDILKPVGVTIEEIQDLAIETNTQGISFEIICLGKGFALMDSVMEENYFIVVESEGLIDFRKKIQELFIKKGGNKKDFNPEKYEPHITVGFTKRDLFESDGVKKNKSSCYYPLKIKS